MGKKQNVEDIYQSYTDIEHVLAEPDTWVGGMDPDTINMYVYDDETERFENRLITFIGGFYKINDEIFTNARDHTVRDKNCKTIKVNIDRTTGKISVWNDGTGIPVVIHKKSNLYVPEMIFGKMRTSSNYKQKNKIVGGKNGFGAKLTNIFSKEFIIETVDAIEKKKYTQVFRNNLSIVENPVIESVGKDVKPYTKITYLPDYERFEMKGLTNDIIALLKKRVFDIAACSTNIGKTVTVYLNDEKIKINNFEDYISLYYPTKPKDLVYANINERWKVGVVFDSESGFKHVSFVNGINTSQGGTHVDYIVDQIVKKVSEFIKKEHKDLTIKPANVKDFLHVYIDSVIEDPSFGSQSKETLKKKVSDFGSTCVIDDDFIKRLAKTDLIKEVIKIAQFKEENKLKKLDGKRIANLLNIPKLEDALDAGKKGSVNTRLILTEGDSAKTLAMTGLEIIGNKKYGVFPLRGKLLNVLRATKEQLEKNEEFYHIIQILGLKFKKTYHSTSELRYGGIIILSDQDDDGFHIKGLIINMIHTFWPSLLITDGFINSYRTPLVKAFKHTDTKKKNPKVFYSLTEFKKWIDEIGNEMSKWDTKYYKGLGTFEPKEGKDIFRDFESHIIKYVWELTEDAKEKAKHNKISNTKEEDSETSQHSEESLDLTQSKSFQKIDMAFNKKRADDRKQWLRKYDPKNTLDHTVNIVPYSEFIDKELIHFSNSDNIRSIPSMIDGLKPSQRKILFACMKRGYNAKELKVSQLAGYVSLHTEYHHGEQSLFDTIIGMAQNFPGSNNINYLLPNGAFGSRRELGNDYASPRYIFTDINPLMSKLFRQEDNYLLNYQMEDNKIIEPEYYVPIIPTILVNGTVGIGTGFSTSIPPHNPIDIANFIIKMINGEITKSIHPWYRGYTGTCEQIDDYKYLMTGKYEIIDERTIRITEIPIKKSMESYKIFLTSITALNAKDMDNPKKKLLDYKFVPYNNKVDVTITFKPNELQKMIKSESIEKTLKLSEKISVSNYYLYDTSGQLTKFDYPSDILEEFYEFRLRLYIKRKEHRLKFLENELMILKYKMKFINDILKKTIIIENKKKDVIIERLNELGYPKVSHDINAKEEEKTYRYLIDMPLFALTKDKIDELNEEFNVKNEELNIYKKTPVEIIWKNEINEFIKAYEKWLADLAEYEADEEKENLKLKKKDKVIKKVNKN